jgi:hypothetical protein
VAIRLLGIAAILVGGGLIVGSKSFAGDLYFLRGNFPASFPGFLRTLVNDYREYPLWAGILLGAVALACARFGRLTLGIVLGFLAVVVVGGWAGVLLTVVSYWVRDFAR